MYNVLYVCAKLKKYLKFYTVLKFFGQNYSLDIILV